jgi:hypothetical protein
MGRNLHLVLTDAGRFPARRLNILRSGPRRISRGKRRLPSEYAPDSEFVVSAVRLSRITVHCQKSRIKHRGRIAMTVTLFDSAVLTDSAAVDLLERTPCNPACVAY